ncbi:MAG: MATE family efflux transporter [Eubacterium sp.]|jgi:putative MATE family efflux protein
MKKTTDFTSGPIMRPLLKFALPVIFANFLQAMYGAVDLMIVGQFASSAELSGVSTGSQLMMALTNIIVSFSVGTTIMLGQQIGRGEGKRGGEIIGSSSALFFLIAVAMTAFIEIAAPGLASLMNAPEEAFGATVSYIRICAAGWIFITSYNLLGSIFRGLGNSRMPLVTVAIACVFNIVGDLFFVAVLGKGAAGAAAATVMAQALSVVISFAIIKKQGLPFEFSAKMIRLHKDIIKKMFKLGTPIAVQDFLVGLSFLVILAIVNKLGVSASAGIGVAEKVCSFVMLVPLAFSQSMSAIVSQNVGARKYDRTFAVLRSGIAASLAAGVFMFWLAFFHGDALCGIFTNDTEVIATAFDYLKAYAIDCLLVSFMFCMVGFFNGYGLTTFVMAQGIIGAFGVRIPVSYAMSKIQPVSIFHIGLATPCSSAVQIVLCSGCMVWLKKKLKKSEL